MQKEAAFLAQLEAHGEISSSRSLSWEQLEQTCRLLVVALVCIDCCSFLLRHYTDATGSGVFSRIDAVRAGTSGSCVKSHFYFLDTLAVCDLRCAVGIMVAVSGLDAAGFDPICIFDRIFPSDGAGAITKVVPDSISVGALGRRRGKFRKPESGMELSRTGHDRDFWLEKQPRSCTSFIDAMRRVGASGS